MDEQTHEYEPSLRLWQSINCSPGLTLAFLIAFFAVIACGQACSKLLWGDELITLGIASQGSLRAIWQALQQGADPNPPLSHWLVLHSILLFGESALAVRLPSMLGMLLAVLSLWTILRRWLQPGYSTLGVLAFMATRGFDYAYDARSYSLLTGFSLAALACWLSTTTSRADDSSPSPLPSRAAAIAGMAVTLSCAVSSNYFGVLAFFPIAAGEIVFTLCTRRPRPFVWLALVTASLPLLVYMPLIRHNLVEFAPHAWNRPHLQMLSESYFVLVEGVFWPVLLGAVWLAWRRPAAPRSPSRTPEPHALAAIATLLLYPLLGLGVAVAGAGMISSRCVLPVCCGFGIAAALLAARIFDPAPRAGVWLLAVALLWVTGREIACAVLLRQQRTAFFQLRNEVAEQRPPGGLILISDSLLALPLAYYSEPAVRRQIVFPIDFAAIHASEPDDSGEQNLWAGRNFFPIRIVPYQPQTLGPRPSLLLARPSGWLRKLLLCSGFSVADFTSPTDLAALQHLGGVFTPMAHEDTRIMLVREPR